MELTEQQLLTTHSIGIFDSGIGGTSIWKEIHSLLPNENTIYLADSKNAPYGIKPKEEIIALCEKNVALLISMQVKIIVVACNTATTNAIEELRIKYNIPFIGIEPAIKPASLNSKTKTIGILATKGTLSSSLFHKTSSTLNNEIKIVEQHGTGIVELIESGQLNSTKMRNLLNSYLQPMLAKNIDHLVLGCSHYPYLIPILKDLLPEHITIIDSGSAVAAQTKRVLEKNNLLQKNSINNFNQFYTNANKTTLKSIVGADFQVNYKDF